MEREKEKEKKKKTLISNHFGWEVGKKATRQSMLGYAMAIFKWLTLG